MALCAVGQLQFEFVLLLFDFFAVDFDKRHRHVAARVLTENLPIRSTRRIPRQDQRAAMLLILVEVDVTRR